MSLKINLFLIDDDKEFAQIFQWKMKPHIDKFQWADSGAKALELYKPDTYDVIVVDKNLPDKRGDIVLKEISKVHPLPPVSIILTGTLMQEQAKKALELGVTRYLEKDFNFGYIAEILHEVEKKNDKTRK